jgi:D-sedoheptulose 7-phosphate isomerase
MRDFVAGKFTESATLKQKLAGDSQLIETVVSMAEGIVHCFQNGGKVLWCGNGGSAADAQHLAAELSGRFYYDRKPLYSEALHVNTSYVTAVANDYGYDQVFSRMVNAAGKAGDILIGLTTSGTSANVLKALQAARGIGMKSYGFTGKHTEVLAPWCDRLIAIPSNDTPRIQECHMLIGHTLCEMVEMRLFPRKSA